MIATLYKCFQRWSEKGSVYIISDTHFDDPDCKLMDPDWITPDEQIAKLKKARRNDTLIHLGDVGNPEYLSQLKCHKVLIMGNHDQSKTKFAPYFDEIFDGPLFIAEKILLSHEPVTGLDWCINIHGHDHANVAAKDKFHLNLAANVCGYEPIDLGREIKRGLLSGIESIHRQTINRATERKKGKETVETVSVRKTIENVKKTFAENAANARRKNTSNGSAKAARRRKRLEERTAKSHVEIKAPEKTVEIPKVIIAVKEIPDKAQTTPETQQPENQTVPSMKPAAKKNPKKAAKKKRSDSKASQKKKTASKKPNNHKNGKNNKAAKKKNGSNGGKKKR